MNKFVLLALFLFAVSCGRLPAPTCRPGFLPSVIPVSIGETVRIDLQNTFDGYNLIFDGLKKDHISITPKYLVNQSKFQRSMNFTSAKLKDHNRFLGLSSHNQFTELAIGTNHPQSGIVIDKILQIQDHPQLHCYDVDQMVDMTAGGHAYAVIDCGVYRMGELYRNQFMFVDLSNYKLVLGSRTSDVFVRYNHLISRKIVMVTDPFSHLQYLYRFYTTQGVDQGHSDQTYVEIFVANQGIMSLQILDVIDHTTLNLPSLAILDFQVHMNLLYLLVRDVGLFQLQFTGAQRLQSRSFFPIKMNVKRFVVQQNGFNDDLHLVFSNQNTIYQYTWDVTLPPVLVTKYALMAGSQVQELWMDQHFVIAQVWENVQDQIQRRTWVFSRRTLSYMNAFGSFKQPNYGPSILLFAPWDRTIHLIQQYRTFNIRLSLPYLIVNPLSTQKAGDQQQYLVKATSIEGGSQIDCRLTFKFNFIENTDTTIFKTGLQGRNVTFVDAPDDTEIQLQYEFFGRNLSYTTITNNVDNSTTVPFVYVEKRVKCQLHFPPEIDQSKIVYYEMFLQNTLQDIQDKNQVFGVVQVQQSDKSYPIYYIRCEVPTDIQFQNPALKCSTLSKSNLSMGKITMMSQMYSRKQRVGAIVFQDQKQPEIYLYHFHHDGFTMFARKRFGWNYQHLVTGIQVTLKHQVIIVFEFGKRIQVYRMEDIAQQQSKPSLPISVIDARIMAFFGVEYFAPVSIKVSIYHDEITFVKTKNGVMAININEMGFPQLLFHIKMATSKYDFEVNENTLVIITESYMAMYRLTLPLRRNNPPFLLQKYNSDFNLNEYDEINSDGLFYLTEKQDTMMLVVHPNMPSTSVIYTEFHIGQIKMIDAVRLRDIQVLFVQNGSSMLAYMFRENPKLRMRWQPHQSNFTLNVSAHNQKSRSDPYSTLFSVIESNEAEIKVTQKFNATAIRKAGNISTKKNAKKFDMNITLHDFDWFEGNVMHYNIKCKDCNKNVSDSEFNIILQNHLRQLNTKINVGQPVYDLRSTFTGIFGQMYSTAFKTYAHNDSIQYLVELPVSGRNEPCTKIFVHHAQDYFMSFCESGGQVNIYVTTIGSFKPFSFGPFETEAEAVNHVEVVGNIVMIVDNDDDPFNRAGGVYLYYLDIAAKNPEDVLTMLDYLDYADLQIEGFRGIPYIASADIVKPMFNKQQYTVFLTQARTGNIFVFLFQVSANRQQAHYLHRRMFTLTNLFPASLPHPTPLRVININMIDYTVRTSPKQRTEYVFILTIRNWHHVQLYFQFDADYDLLSFELVRLYERVPYPWELTNFIRLRQGYLNASYFAVNYRDYTVGSQLLVVYQLPYFRLPEAQARGTSDKLVSQAPEAGINVTRSLAAYRIQNTAETAFEFNMREEHRMLFSDASNNHLQQLQLNKELKLIIKNADPSKFEEQDQNITIIAQNHYTNFSFLVQVKFVLDKDDDDDDKGTKSQIIWIIILVIGFVVIVGLIFVWSRQNKNKEQRDSAAIKQSLLTVQPQFKSNYINRSSADPESVRHTVDYTATQTENKKLEKVQEDEEEDAMASQEIKHKDQELKEGEKAQ